MLRRRNASTLPRDEFGYRLWDPANNKIVRSRDVVFFEDQTIEDIRSSTKPTRRGSKSGEQCPTPTQREVTNDGVDADGHEETDGEETSPNAQPDPEEQSTTPPEPEPRRSSRAKRPSNRYSSDEYVTLTEEGEPQSYKEAIADSHKEEWVRAMQDEMQSLHENHTSW